MLRISYKNKIPFLSLILFSLIFIFSFYGDIILNPDSYFFSNEGDAIKNYFTYAYHIKHDTSYLNFSGMNYPYGEHFMYTDCHPVLANLFKFLSAKFDFFSDHSIGILNFIMLFSIFLTFVVSYFLLLQFKISKWFSVLFAIIITILAPQIFRLGGHFALSYSVAIPFSWLLFLKIQTLNETKQHTIIVDNNRFYKLKKSNNVFLLLMFINILFWFFIHAYLGLIIVFFLLSLHTINLIKDRENRSRRNFYFKQFAVLILPIILFYLFTSYTDSHTGRTINPSGFFLYNAEFDDIFLPHHPPIRPILDSLTGGIIDLEWEAWSYVGFTTTLIFATFLIWRIIQLIKRKKSATYNLYFQNHKLNNALIASSIVLLFAMAIPFKQIEGLINLLPILKQFRGTGRFTWPFYFVAIVFSASVIQDLYFRLVSKKRKLFAISLIISIGLLNVLEGLSYHIGTYLHIIQSENNFKKSTLSPTFKDALNSIHSSDYQAIIALPFYYQGSESYSRPRNNETVLKTINFSYHTGIPLVNANLTRTSIQESKNIIQLVSPDFYFKSIQEDLKSEKPFLVIRTKDPITAYESEIFKKCKVIFESNEISIYSLTKADLFKNSAKQRIANYKLQLPNLFLNGEFYTSIDSSYVFYNGFEDRKTKHSFRGYGGIQTIKKGKNTFAEFSPNTFEEGKKYQVSLWMYNGIPDALNNWFRFFIEEYNETADKWTSTEILIEQSEVIYGNWSLIEGEFEVKKSTNKIYIATKGKDDSREPLFVDDLFIREVGVDVYKLNGNSLFYNNHEIKGKSKKVKVI